MLVTKLSGKKEEVDLSKMRASLSWASNCLDVDIMEVESNSHIQFYDGIQTRLIHEILIKTAYDMSSIENPDYDIMSARLSIQKIYKKVFNSTKPYSLSKYISKYSSVYNDKINLYSSSQCWIHI